MKVPTHLPLRPLDAFESMKKDCEFFLNSEGEPTIRIPDDNGQSEWRADDPRVRDYLTKEFLDINQEHADKWGQKDPQAMLKSNEIDFILALIREECRSGGIKYSPVEEERIEADAIFQGCVMLVNELQDLDIRSCHLAAGIKNLRDQGHISGNNLPVLTNLFTRRLRRLAPALAAAGIEVVIEHKEDGSHTKLKTLPNFVQDANAIPVIRNADGSLTITPIESSGKKSKQDKDLEGADDADGEKRTDPPEAKQNLNVAEGEQGPEQAAADASHENRGDA